MREVKAAKLVSIFEIMLVRSNDGLAAPCRRKGDLRMPLRF